MIRLACAVIAALLVGLFSSTPAADTSHTETPTVVAYNYDDTQHTAAPNQTKGERAPPAEVFTSTYNAIDRWSHGNSRRTEGNTSGATTTYDTPDEFARHTVAARTTLMPTLAHVGELSSFRRSEVAANAGGDAARFVTGADGVTTDLIAPSGKLPFPRDLIPEGMTTNAYGNSVWGVGPEGAKAAMGRSAADLRGLGLDVPGAQRWQDCYANEAWLRPHNPSAQARVELMQDIIDTLGGH